jgi:hypothetical protein
MMWSAAASRVIDPYLFDETVKGVPYLGKQRNYVISELTSRVIMGNGRFQQDGALAYFTLSVREFMITEFPDRWVWSWIFSNSFEYIMASTQYRLDHT